MKEESPWNRPVFACGPWTVTVRDVFDAAYFRGDLELPWKRLLETLASEEAANSDGADEAVLQTMSEQFRFERDLITAEETESWLEERGLTLEEFSNYFLRHYWQESALHQPAPQMLDYLSAPEELRNSLRIELLLDGEFDHLAAQWSWRAAAFHIFGNETTPEALASERSRFFERFALDDASLGDWLERMGTDQTWLDQTLALEAAYRRETEKVVTAQVCERMLQLLRLPLTRLDVEVVELESDDAAREAFLCVSSDGASMAEVAKDGRYPYSRTEVVLEDFPAESRQQVLCAAPGEVLEPMPRGDGFQLVRLLRKIDPDLNNPAVRQRVEQQALERHFSELAAKCVRWIIPVGSTPEDAS